MRIGEITSKLRSIGDFYKQKSDGTQGKHFAFYKASSVLLKELGKDFEVDEHYDFRVFDGIADGINDRIHKMISDPDYRWEYEEEGSIDNWFDSLPVDLKDLFSRHKIKSSNDIKNNLEDPIKCNLFPDFVIKHFGRTRIIDEINYIVNTIPFIAVGSYRRGLPTIKDLDFLIVAETQQEADDIVDKAIKNTPLIFTPINKGKLMRRFLVSYNGVTIGCDFKVVKSESIGTALIHFTGPARSNIIIRAKVSKLGYTLNEYGLFNSEGDNLASNMNEVRVIKLLKSIGVTLNENPSER